MNYGICIFCNFIFLYIYMFLLLLFTAMYISRTSFLVKLPKSLAGNLPQGFPKGAPHVTIFGCALATDAR